MGFWDWRHHPGGLNGGPPLEFFTEYCTRAGVGMWYNIGLFYSADYITRAVINVARSGVKELVLELSNEVWNFGEVEYFRANNLGNALGLGGGRSHLGFQGLRTIQMAKLAADAWTAAGRSRTELKIASGYQFVSGGYSESPTQTYQFNGADLNASATGRNAVLKAYGGLGAANLTTDHSTFPNRPVDCSDYISPAIYFGGAQYNSGNGNPSLNLEVPLSSYNSSLLAAYNYVNGNPTKRPPRWSFCTTEGPRQATFTMEH